MEASALADAVLATLSPTLAARGFGPGGPGLEPDGRVSLLFCAGAQVVASRWPEVVDLLRADVDFDVDAPGMCLDLVVEASNEGELERVELDGVALSKLAQSMTLDRIARRTSIEELRGVTGEDAAARIGEAVIALLPADAVE